MGWPKGKKRNFSEKHRRNLSKALRGRKGKPKSEEFKRRLSATRKGRIGPLAPNWKGGPKPKPKCVDCGVEIGYGSTYCRKCSKKGTRNHRWTGGPKKGVCVDCGKEISFGSTYCSRCRYTGERHPRWNGGSSFEPYSPEFTEELKLKIRTRDDFTCQKCGRTEEKELEEFGRVLPIHHIDEVKKNDEETNLITLCLRCNIEVSKDLERWQPVFEKLILSKYPTKFQLKKRVKVVEDMAERLGSKAALLCAWEVNTAI